MAIGLERFFISISLSSEYVSNRKIDLCTRSSPSAKLRILLQMNKIAAYEFMLNIIK